MVTETAALRGVSEVENATYCPAVEKLTAGGGEGGSAGGGSGDGRGPRARDGGRVAAGGLPPSAAGAETKRLFFSPPPFQRLTDSLVFYSAAAS